jgi:hypothetical protein
MVTNMTWLEFNEWQKSVLKKMDEPGEFFDQMIRSTLGHEEKSTGESFTQLQQGTDSTTCTVPDVKTSYTSVSQITWSGISKLTPELEAAIAEVAKTFASTISSLMEREMMITCGFSEGKLPPRTDSLTALQLESMLRSVRYMSF